MLDVEVNAKIDQDSIINLSLGLAVAGAFIVLISAIVKNKMKR